VSKNRMVETSCRAPSVGRAEAPELERPKKHDAGPGGPASAMDSRSTRYSLPCVRLRLPQSNGVVMVVPVMQTGTPHDQ